MVDAVCPQLSFQQRLYGFAICGLFIVAQSWLNDVVAKVLANEVYDESKVATWVDRICDQSMQKLTQMNKPFKYVVTCILMQKNGAGVHTGQSCFWDVANDNCARIAYPLASKKQAYDPRMYCVVTCFGVSM